MKTNQNQNQESQNGFESKEKMTNKASTSRHIFIFQQRFTIYFIPESLS